METTIKRREVDNNANALPHELHPLLRRIYFARGVQSSTELEHELTGLIPADQLSQIDVASQVLAEALMAQQRILIVGDYDADGATSSALVVRCLRSFGAKQVDYLVPNRFEYGYGLTPEIVELAAKQQPDIIITVDNGIMSHDGVARANALGIKVVVTDHHLAGDTLPDAAAIVNPNQPGDTFPSKNLAGVGVAFYVMLALRARLRELGWFSEQRIKEPNMSQFLDIVALGTVADVVPLDKNNRILVQQGLKRICAGKCVPGIAALVTVGKRDIRRLVASDLGFIVAPRINAAGRLDDMSLGVACLLAENSVKAQLLAKQLDELNNERKQLEADMRGQAMAHIEKLKIEEKALPLGFCLYDKTWHQGVIGIVAARMKDHYHRPAIAFADSDDDEIKGSARSVPGLHMRDLFDAIAVKNPGLLSKYGGHAMAAGLSLQRAQLDAFRLAFLRELEAQYDESMLTQVILSDGELNQESLNLETATLLRQSGPWGQAFPEPVFDGEFKLIDQRLVGQKHLKMIVQSPEGESVDAIAFNVDLQQWLDYQCKKVRLAYQLDVNEFRGVRQLQLMVKYIEKL